MIKLTTSVAIALALAGCAGSTNAPPIKIDAHHPASPDAAAVTMPAMSNTLAIDAASTTAPAPATKEAMHEHHH
jgi:hypothetical protein